MGGGRGECQCGKCICPTGWGGSDCECQLNEELCKDPEDPRGLICSGHGDCECGLCRCRDDGYSGPFCGECHTCPDKCVSLKPCIECLAFKSGDNMDNFDENLHEYPGLFISLSLISTSLTFF